MNIAAIGPWILFLVALAGCIGAGIRICRKQANKGIYFLLVFSGLFAGTSVYGLSFMDHYTNFLGAVAKLQASPTPQTYADFFAKVGDGKITPRYAELGLAYTLDRPVPQMDTLLDQTIARATNPQGKAALTQTLRDFKGKQHAAEELTQALRNTRNPDQAIERLDPTTRAMVSRQILSLPASQVATQHVNTNMLRTYLAPRSLRIGKDPQRIGP